MTAPLMPKATAVWLIDNTALTFDQIALFCGLHPLEVRGIADGDVATGIKGLDPISNGQLSREEIERCQEDPTAILTLAESKRDVPPPKPRKGAKYTPLSKRQERPDAISWLLRNHPELNDAQISRLVGTTKVTIETVRDRSHWNISNIKPVDPVSLGLSTQIELDNEVAKAARRVERQRKAEMKAAGITGAVLQDADVTTGFTPEAPATETFGQGSIDADSSNSDAPTDPYSSDEADNSSSLSAEEVFSSFKNDE